MWFLSSVLWTIALLLLAGIFEGQTATYGPANEVCVTSPGTVLTTASAWESTIEGASSGAVFLLRGGTYNFGTESPGLSIPAGVTVKAYGSGTCEDVKITGAATEDDVGTFFNMGANSTLRGVSLEAAKTGNRHELLFSCRAANIVIQNNNLWGGTGDAIEIDGACDNFKMIGNDINGSSADNNRTTGRTVNGGNNIHFTGGADGTQPDIVLIKGNRICSDYFPDVQRSDDTIAIESGTDVIFEDNYFPSACGKNKENIMDIKTDTCGTQASVLFIRNYVERNFYVGTVGGQDGASFQGAFTVGDHCGETPVQKHRFELNFIGNCHALVTLDNPDQVDDPDTDTEFGGGCGGIGTGGIVQSDPFKGTGRVANTSWKYNVFLQDNIYHSNPSGGENRLQFGNKGYKLEYIHNTFIRGRWRVQNQLDKQASGPATFKDNLFHTVYILDDTSAASKYNNSYNTFYNSDGALIFSNGNNLTTNPLLRDITGTTPGDVDLRPDDGSPVIGSASDGKNRGAFQEITCPSGTITGTNLVLSCQSDYLAMSACYANLFDIEYNGIDAVETACNPGPAPHQVTVKLSAPPPAGATVTAKWSYGAVEDSMRIGGSEINLNNKLRARTSPLTITGTGATPSWVQGNQIACGGSNRIVPVVFCWEKLAITTPTLITNVRVGGQLGTKIVELDSPDYTPGLVATYGAAWYFTDAQLSSATNSTITYDTSEPEDADRPLQVASGCYPNITNQTTPITDSDISLTTTLPPLTTFDPGAAFVAGCAGTAVSWSISSPWQERLDWITGNTASQMVADATTDGMPLTPTPVATGSRLVTMSVALGGGAPVIEPGPHQHKQTHVAMYQYGASEGGSRICPIDGPCELSPTRRFVARAQVEIEGAALPTTSFEWWCSDNDGEYYPVSAQSDGWISFATSMRGGDVLTNQLPLEGDTFASCGTHYSIETTATTCSASTGSRLEYEMSGVVSALATPNQTTKCELRKAPNTLLDEVIKPVVINITGQRASGF